MTTTTSYKKSTKKLNNKDKRLIRKNSKKTKKSRRKQKGSGILDLFKRFTNKKPESQENSNQTESQENSNKTESQVNSNQTESQVNSAEFEEFYLLISKNEKVQMKNDKPIINSYKYVMVDLPDKSYTFNSYDLKKIKISNNSIVFYYYVDMGNGNTGLNEETYNFNNINNFKEKLQNIFKDKIKKNIQQKN
jgi:hypothetical protein